MNIEPSKDDRELADRILATLHNSNEMDHVAAAKVIAEWNTRPQPAPPEGEPDFEKLGNYLIELVKAGVSATWVHVELERMFLLGLAARPKVEDADEWLKSTELYRQWRDMKAKLAEREAELAKADAVINWFDDYCGPSFRELAGEFLIAKFEAAIKRHAARQQQKD